MIPVGTLRGTPPREVYIGPEVGWRPLGVLTGATIVQLRGRYRIGVWFDGGPVPGVGDPAPEPRGAVRFEFPGDGYAGARMDRALAGFLALLEAANHG